MRVKNNSHSTHSVPITSYLKKKKRTHTTSLLTDSLVCHTEDTQADTSLNYVRLPFPQQPHVLFGFIYIQVGKQVIGRQKTIFPKKKIMSFTDQGKQYHMMSEHER